MRYTYLKQSSLKQLSHKEHGFVAIIVAMILLVLISLVALGFAFLVRQNQHESLNRRLSTQAFYAAESAVNGVVKELVANPNLGDKTACQSTPTAIGDGGASYTCVLLNKQPGELKYDSISANESTVVRLTSANGAAIRRLQISWEDAGSNPGGSIFANSGSPFYLPNQPTYSGSLFGNPSQGFNTETARFPQSIGMLRATILPNSAVTSTGSSGTNPSSNNLLTNSQTLFLYPRASSTSGGNGTVAYSTSMSGDGSLVSGECNANKGTKPRRCNVIITTLNTTDLWLRLKAIYKPVAVTVVGLSSTSSSSTATVPLSGGQAVIDATGKAQDVVRRIQVRVPLASSYYFPEFGLETAETICKRYAVWPGPTNGTGGAEVISPNPALYPNLNVKLDDEKACQIPGQSRPSF